MSPGWKLAWTGLGLLFLLAAASLLLLRWSRGETERPLAPDALSVALVAPQAQIRLGEAAQILVTVGNGFSRPIALCPPNARDLCWNGADGQKLARREESGAAEAADGAEEEIRLAPGEGEAILVPDALAGRRIRAGRYAVSLTAGEWPITFTDKTPGEQATAPVRVMDCELFLSAPVPAEGNAKTAP